MMKIAPSDPKKTKEKTPLTPAEENEQEKTTVIQNEDEAATNIDTAVVNADVNGVPAPAPVPQPTAQEETQKNAQDQADIAEVAEQERIVNDNQDEIGID